MTLWFVTTPEPRTVMEAEPPTNRGFARKYLAQLNPRWPLTHIGDFDMSRSAEPGVHEFYIGSYPGLSVVQWVLENTWKLSELPERYRTLVSAPEVYATAVAAGESTVLQEASGSGYGAFAHWSNGQLKRAFSATRETVFEDQGLPGAFEMPFWEGNMPATGIQLPFIPEQLAEAATENWLGFSPRNSGLEVVVSAFATDGRPEAKTEVKAESVPRLAQAKKRRPDDVSVFEDEQGYDDYSSGVSFATSSGEELSNRELAKDVISIIGGGFATGFRVLGSMAGKIGNEVRRRARHTDRK
ncbi:DUF6928 family protein [Corynebacterium anserum]|uniref:DUF6928 family protein n=1 Tax=Corynebacterium anserum TaxID=2684406 RepID=UPI0028BF38AD|nr:hypothetical protein [Corynebacterium anserum]